MDKNKVFGSLRGNFNKFRNTVSEGFRKIPGFARDTLQFLNDSRKTIDDSNKRFDKVYNVLKSEDLVPEALKDKIDQGINEKNRVIAESSRITDKLNRVNNVLSQE
jgi:hypothetical protein